MEILSRQNIEDIAAGVLNDAVLEVGGSRFRIVELEMYKQSPDHPDPYVHSSPIQRMFGKLYFHTFRGSFREGTYRGMDITFGNEEISGGILVRSIEKSDGTIEEGPCKCVNRFLQTLGFNSVTDLVTSTWGSNPPDAFADDSLIKLVPVDDLDQRRVFASPRIGLAAKRDIRFLSFLMKRYRFLTRPTLSKNKIMVAVSMVKYDNISEDDVVKLCNIRRSKLTEIVETFDEATTVDPLVLSYKNRPNVKELISLYGALFSAGHC